jgi:hypothetical protein
MTMSHSSIVFSQFGVPSVESTEHYRNSESPLWKPRSIIAIRSALCGNHGALSQFGEPSVKATEHYRNSESPLWKPRSTIAIRRALCGSHGALSQFGVPSWNFMEHYLFPIPSDVCYLRSDILSGTTIINRIPILPACPASFINWPTACCKPMATI